MSLPPLYPVCPTCKGPIRDLTPEDCEDDPRLLCQDCLAKLPRKFADDEVVMLPAIPEMDLVGMRARVGGAVLMRWGWAYVVDEVNTDPNVGLTCTCVEVSEDQMEKIP